MPYWQTRYSREQGGKVKTDGLMTRSVGLADKWLAYILVVKKNIFILASDEAKDKHLIITSREDSVF